jgi:high-affinity Fe2+/Pb2+ permease
VAVSLLNVSKKRQVTVMNILLIIAVVLAVLFFFGGGLVPSLNFLIWVGVVLLILAAVGFFRGRRRT